MKEKILITGATGYIGSNIVKALMDEGSEIHILTRPTSQYSLLNDLIDKINIHIYEGEIEQLREIFDKVKPDMVVHIAALFISEHKMSDVGPLLMSNIVFGTQLLEVSRASGVKYFINTGTSWQNYLGEQYNPVNLYAATKKAFEDIAQYYLQTSLMRMITLKLTDTYGPGDPRKKIINLLKDIAHSGESLDTTLGEQHMNLVYVDDVVKAFMLAIEKIMKMSEHEYKAYMIASNENYSLREVASIFESINKVKLKMNWGKRAYRAREIMTIQFYEENILSCEEIISLEEGMRKMREVEQGQ